MSKIATDLEQSKELAKILPVGSADMTYFLDSESLYPFPPREASPHLAHIPSWSLSALLDVLSDYTLQTNIDGTVFVICESKEPIISDSYNYPVDACVDMILKLKEWNLL